MTTMLWLLVVVVASVGCFVFGAIVGGASSYLHLQKHHPEAWRVLQADGAEERAAKRFAAKRSTSTSTAREW